jgi:hypothetical protein
MAQPKDALHWGPWTPRTPKLLRPYNRDNGYNGADRYFHATLENTKGFVFHSNFKPLKYRVFQRKVRKKIQILYHSQFGLLLFGHWPRKGRCPLISSFILSVSPLPISGRSGLSPANLALFSCIAPFGANAPSLLSSSSFVCCSMGHQGTVDH